MSYNSDCIEKFNLLPSVLKDALGSNESILAIKKIEIEHDIDLKFLVVLVAIGEVEFKDIPSYLNKESGIDISEAYGIKNELLYDVFGFLLEEYSPVEIKEIFEKKLLSTVQNEFISNSLNKELIASVGFDDLKNDDLLKFLYENAEEIGHKGILIDGKQVASSVANWIKDFIKKEGSGRFNNLVLSEYISNSDNTKKLSDSEKNILRKILSLYGNLKFFPESFENVPPEKWHFITVDDASEPAIKKMVGKKAAPRNDTTAQLMEMADSFLPGSLERKAIEEEMKKIKN